MLYKIEFFGVIFSGVETVSVDMNDLKMTIIGNVDAVIVVGKLRKCCDHADILSVGPAKEKKEKGNSKRNIILLQLHAATIFS